jgi:rhodanese-related sulfurtransferase
MPMPRLVLITATVLLAGVFWALGGTRAQGIEKVSVQDLAKLEEPYVLDVREAWAYQEGHTEDAALIPLAELLSRLAEVPRGQNVYVVCRSGNRSAQASDLLVRGGYKTVLNVEGSMIAGQQAGFPTVR